MAPLSSEGHGSKNDCCFQLGRMFSFHLKFLPFKKTFPSSFGVLKTYFQPFWLWLSPSCQSAWHELHSQVIRHPLYSLSNTLIFAWFTSKTGMYHYHTQSALKAICCYFRTNESPLNLMTTQTCSACDSEYLDGWRITKKWLVENKQIIAAAPLLRIVSFCIWSQLRSLTRSWNVAFSGKYAWESQIQMYPAVDKTFVELLNWPLGQTAKATIKANWLSIRHDTHLL